jgi:hypothetical protein
MEFLKWVAGAVLLIMVYTWSRISIEMGVMVAVSENFIYVAGFLVSIVSGQGVKDLWQNRPGGRQ